MRNPTKAQRTAAAKEMLKDAMRFSSAYDGYVETDDGEFVVVGGCAIYVGKSIDGIFHATDLRDKFAWQPTLHTMQELPRTVFTDWSPQQVQKSLDRQKAVARANDGCYRKHTARIRFPLENGKEIGFDCEYLLAACKLVGNTDYVVGYTTIHQPVLALPQTQRESCMISGEYGTVYLLPCRI